MREILFRGKCADTGKWYQGQYIHLHKTTYCIKEDYDKDKNNDIHQIVFEKMTDWGLPNQHLRVDVIPETVGQYTGLTDKNGNKIFEEDIIQSLETKETAVVQWFPEHSTFMVWCKSSNEVGFLYECTKSNIEVIGDIYDNPELLNHRENLDN